MLQVKRRDQITFLHSDVLGRIPGVIHAFSTRRSERDDFTLGPAAPPNPMGYINRTRFLAAIGAAGWPIIKLKQVHSGIVAEMNDSSAASETVEGDAAVTALKGAAVGVQTADCVPILISDSLGRVVAAVHAGWRGTAARIVETTVGKICQRLSIDPNDLVAVIGPHIGVCCYEVGQEVVDAIANPAPFEYRPEWTKPHLNLSEANRRQLLESGVPDRQIEVSSLCTRCREDLFHSYRRDGKKTGYMLSVIGIAP